MFVEVLKAHTRTTQRLQETHTNLTMKVHVPAAIFMPALLISPNNAFAAPRWASCPEATGVGACTAGGGGGAGLPGGGATDPAPALATFPY